MSSLIYILLGSPAAVSIFSGLARHALTTFGAVLVARHYASGADIETLTGAVVTLVGIVWSIGTKALPDAAVTPADPK